MQYNDNADKEAAKSSIVVVLHQLLELMGLLQSLQSAESSADPIARLRNFKDLALQISSQVADNPNQVLSGPIRSCKLQLLWSKLKHPN
jgi:hypothetical protein